MISVRCGQCGEETDGYCERCKDLNSGRYDTMMTEEEHKEIHITLHKALDQLLADMIGHTKKLYNRITIMELIEWSHEQTINPTEYELIKYWIGKEKGK